MENCNDCPCSCKPVSAKCITSNSDITDPTILKKNHYQKATDDIDSLLGIDCADELCEALKQAVIDLNAYNLANPGANDKTIEDFLLQKWLDVVTNRHFKKWYSNRLLWHWVHGASTSQLTSSGLITLNNSDASYKNNFAQAVEIERKRMENSAQFYSDGARSKFIKTFWNKNFGNYSCVELECGCVQKCECKNDAPPNNGIGMVII